MAAKKKRWTEEAINNATKDVLEGNLSVRRPAVQYDIPSSTLHDRTSGKMSGTVSGPPHYLDEEEERELVEFYWDVRKLAIQRPKTVKEVRAMVGKIVAKKQHQDIGSTAPVSHGWWEKFQKRHHELSLRSSETLSQRRAVAMSPAVLIRSTRRYLERE